MQNFKLATQRINKHFSSLKGFKSFLLPIHRWTRLPEEVCEEHTTRPLKKLKEISKGRRRRKEES